MRDRMPPEFRMKRVAGLVLAAAAVAGAANLTLTQGGKVTVELLTSDAFFHNTLSLIAPAGAVVASSGCNLEPAPGIPGIPLLSEKVAQHGCRVELDADGATPGIQGFPAGTTLKFGLCAQTDADPECDFIWTSDPADNSDGMDHVITTPLLSAEYPGRIFQLGWEDKDASTSDNDFNDLIATVRVDMDQDGDGLWDDWETHGIDVDGNGTIDLDLPALGARPDHKDLFIEIDWMDCALPGGDCAPGDTHSHRPKDAAVAAAVQAFANAPVTNPDGVNGINLHIDLSNAIPHQNNMNIPGLCFAGGSGIGSFDDLKADPANFGPQNPRRFAYHYSIWAHQQVSTSTSSGCGELPGNDFEVTFGGWNLSGPDDRDGDGTSDRNVGTIQQQAGTLIHEFGHNLNLGHGGNDGTNYKPNYLSLMNYWFQLGGVPPTDPDAGGPLTGQLLLSSGLLASLAESSLNEPVGVGAGTNNTFFACPGGSTASGNGTGPVDWNCNGNNTETGVAADINKDGSQTTLTDFDDWTHIKYALQSTGAFEDGVRPPAAPQVEIDHPTYLAEIVPDLSLGKSASPSIVVTGTSFDYTLTVKNSRPEGARNVVVTDTLPPGTSFVACAGGICGGSGNARTISLPLLPGGASRAFTLSAALSCAVADGSVIGNTASAAFSLDDPTPADNTASASIVARNPPPVISGVSASKQTLWPPNHSMVEVKVNYDVRDNCAGVVCSLDASSNEPENGLGDGDVGPDWQIVDAHTVRLRAERSGTGSGRIYTVPITCKDSGGATSAASVNVRVPLSQ